MSAPLSGITIIEATGVNTPPAVAIAAGFCAKLAAGLGATVLLSAELARRPGLPDPLRAFLDKGKMVGARDEVAQSADAAIGDARAVDRLGDSSPPILVALGAANTAPQQGLETEFSLAARTGVLDMIGDPDRAPLPLPGHQPAFAAGLAAYTGLAAALLRRRLDSSYRERVDANIEDVLLWLNWKSVLGESWGVETPTRKGRLTEWPILRCADGWAALVYRDVEWPALKRLVDDSRLDEQRFESREGRHEYRAELFDIVEAAFARFSRAELTRRSLELRLPIGPVLEPHELLTDAQYMSRNIFERLTLGDGTTRPVPRLPVIWHKPQSPRAHIESAA